MRTLNKILILGGGLGLAIAAVECNPGSGPPATPTGVMLEVSSDSNLGSVTSDVGGIDCGTVCSVSVPSGTAVTLTATPLAGTNATFLGWSGPCSGTAPTCTVTVSDATTVTASWMPQPQPDMATPPDLMPLPGPTITSVAPAYAQNNVTTKITVTGANFRSGATVTVGGQTCANPSVVSATQLTCTVPMKAATCWPQAVVVTNPDAQNASKSLFSYRAASVAFATPVTLTGTGSGPHRMVLADFNNDGNLDLVVANNGDGSISFLAGDGKGGFATAVPTTGFSAPEGVAIADIDQDTNLDVAVVNPGANNVLVFKGDGKGGLTMGTPVSVGSSARYLALVDFNGDKFPDLLVPNQADNTISYRPNKANKALAFNTGSDLPAGTDPYEVIVADVNNDQSQDLLFTSANGNSVGVLLGNGQGAFAAATGSPFAVGSFPAFMSVNDFNGDGKLDFVTANQSSSNLSILAGSGSGGFAAVTGSPVTGGSGPTGVGSGDFNGDGLIDLANSNFFAGTAQVRLATCISSSSQ